MKKLLIGAVGVVALSFAFAGTPVAAPGVNPSKYCTDNDDLGLSHGECTSLVARFFNKTGSDDAAAFCKRLKLDDPATFDANFKNLGQCVKSFH